jgi:hypothetical protein
MPRFYPVAVGVSVAVLTIAPAVPAAAQTAPAVTRERPALGSTITVDVLGELPTGANLVSLLDAAQSEVISDRLDTGGLSTGEAARIGAHGSSWTQTRYRIGASTITDPDGTGSPLLIPGAHMWERVDVTTGLIPIDGGAPGLSITLEPRHAGTAWTRSIEALLARPWLLSRVETTTPPAIARLQAATTGNLFLAGPIDPGRLGVVISADWARSARFERDSPTRLDATDASLFTHLEFTPDADNAVRTVAWVQRTRYPFANRTAIGEPSAAGRATAVHVQSAWNR